MRGVAGIEHSRADHQPRNSTEKGKGDHHAEDGAYPLADHVQEEGGGPDQPPFEHDQRVGKVRERFIAKQGIAVEVGAFADLGPGGVDAARGDLEEGIDDPYTEIFAAGALK